MCSLLGLEIQTHKNTQIQKYKDTETQKYKYVLRVRSTCAASLLGLASCWPQQAQTNSRPQGHMLVCSTYIRYIHNTCTVHIMYKYKHMQGQSPNELDNDIPLPMYT